LPASVNVLTKTVARPPLTALRRFPSASVNLIFSSAPYVHSKGAVCKSVYRNLGPDAKYKMEP